MRKQVLAFAFVMTLAAGQADEPRFTAKNELLPPANYREWVWLSSGLGMSYAAEPGGEPTFDNVFVGPVAYKSLWPPAHGRKKRY